MSKQKPIEPRWLVSLLVCWARRDLHDEIRGLGYYSINPMLKDGIPGRVRSYQVHAPALQQAHHGEHVEALRGAQEVRRVGHGVDELRGRGRAHHAVLEEAD